MKFTQSITSIPIPPRRVAEALVAWLNRPRVPAVFRDDSEDYYGWSGRACRERLREYTDTWIAAGYRLDQWAGREQVEQIATGKATVTIDQPVDDNVHTVVNIEDEWANYEPPSEAEAEAAQDEADDLRYEIEENEGHKQAAKIFLAFITGPYYNHIGSCARCSRYFLNTSGHSNKRFCSARCARINSAVKSKRERDQRDHQQKVARLKRAVQMFSRLSTVRQRQITDMKGWLSHETGISFHFITRTLNQGLLELSNSPSLTTIQPRKGKRT